MPKKTKTNTSRALTNSTLENLKMQLIKRTRTSLTLKRLAWPLLKNTSKKVIPPFATGAKRQEHQQLDGNGSLQRKSGTDGTTTSGTTGVSPRRDSLM